MICYIYDELGRILIRKEERTPVHSQDFCDRCGDCLDCYQDDGCVDGNHSHFWVIYGDSEQVNTPPQSPTASPSASQGEIIALKEQARQ